MMLATSAKPPLRDRRRAAVERVALDLALEHGYDAVTVPLIDGVSGASAKMAS